MKKNGFIQTSSKIFMVVGTGLLFAFLWLFGANQSAIVAKAETYQVGTSPQAFCDTVTEIPVSQCEVLVSLYNSTNGDNWISNTGWLQTNTPCSWYGVECEGGNNVLGIRLRDNNLSGTIPNEIGNMTTLNGLRLDNNNLTGTIPSEIGNLIYLDILYLDNNQLSGSIPPEFGNLSNVFDVDLGRNQLSGDIPQEIANLTNIQLLYLNENQLAGEIPPGLGSLSGLLELNLNDNQLTGNIPVTLGSLSNLEALSLSGNQLTGSIPPELGNLSKLLILQLGNNLLTGTIPIELGNLSALESLHLTRNQLTGQIPPELGNLSNLVDLALGLNPYTGTIPAELGDLSNLEHLQISEAYIDGITPGLHGPIPPELGNLSKLRSLNFCETFGLDGKLPPEFGNLQNLETLWLCYLGLTGSIPQEIGNLTNLHTLSLAGNSFTGTIPAEIGNLTNLINLNLNDNFLEGEIPSTITNLVNLEMQTHWMQGADFGYNKLVATDPDVIAFLEEKDPDWADTQTYPPSNLAVDETHSASVDLAWTPINYTWGGGFYEVSYSTHLGDLYAVHGATSSKYASTYTADSLLAGTTYYFKLRTCSYRYTDTCLWSDYSQVVSATLELTGTQSEITPEQGETLLYTNTQGSTTSVEIPSNSVTETTTVQFMPIEVTTEPQGFSIAGQSFALDAFQDGIRLVGFQFQQPVTITLEYRDEDITTVNEDELLLMFWNENINEWVDAASTCNPASVYLRDTENNVLSVAICHLSEFALFGEDFNYIYLPIITNSNE